MSGVVILGAGHAGSQLAVSLREEGYAGQITLVDAQPDLPYHKPPLSKTFLKSPEALPQPLRTEQAYAEAGIARVTGLAIAIDPVARRLVMADAEALSFDELVLATGARNRTLPNLQGRAGVFSLRNLADAQALRTALSDPRRVVVVGGGFIGLETAAALVGMGHRVTVLEAMERVLARVAAPETSAFVEKALRDLGLNLRTGWTGTISTDVDGAPFRFAADGDEVDADIVLVGIGATAAMELAQAAGIACERGILTNDTLATNIANIWAIGDAAQTPNWQTGAAERLESVQNATDQAKTLARTLASGNPEAVRAVPWFWSDIGPVKLQIAGLATGADERILRTTADKLAVFHLKGGKLVAVETINNAADHLIARRLIEEGITPTRDDIQAGPIALKALVSK